MLFNSLEFLLFLGLFFALWPLMKRGHNRRWLFLTVASFFFYGWWDWRFLFLLFGTGLWNYLTGLWLEPRHAAPEPGEINQDGSPKPLPEGEQNRARRPGGRWLLALNVVINLLPLALFKYLDFGIRNANELLGWFGMDSQIPLARLVLPVGISFYTFQAMSYSIGVYRRELKPTRNLLHFLAYLSCFPQLVAGPIVRAQELLPQLTQQRDTTEQDRWDGFKLIVFGYFKKVVVADTIAPAIAVAMGAKTMVPSSGYWWMIMVMFAYQIYCDFSGYSDIARGLGKWMGYDFPLNFDHPYIARSFREFWARWHISLSTWFRDYVYIPLGGSRKGGAWTAHRNMWITMLLSGLWHGAAWTFIFWSALHAGYLSLERLTKWPKKVARIPVIGEHLVTLLVFMLTVIAWVFFVSHSAGQAVGILKIMLSFGNFFDFAGAEIDNNAINVFLLILARQLFFHFRLNEREWLSPQWSRRLEPIALAVLVMLCVFMRGPADAFIYFQF